jgi:maltose alpha-D-glucosyltransferase/alpha-amylase
LNDPDSLLSLVRKMIELRKQSLEIGRGDDEVLNSGSDNVLALRYRWHGHELTALHNFSPDQRTARVSAKASTQWRNLLDPKQAVCAPAPDGTLKLEGYGYRWYRTVEPQADAASLPACR